MTQEDLRKEIRGFLARHRDFSKTRFGLCVMRDRSFVTEVLENGREPRRATRKKVREWIADYEAGLAINAKT